MTTAPETETETGPETGPGTGTVQQDARLRERTFSWDDPVAIARAGAGMSGAEFFAAIAAGKVPPPPVMRALDFDGVLFEEGRAVFRLTPREFHYNPLGTVHGGYAATLLDSCMGCAVHSTLPKGVSYTTLEFKVSLLRAVTSDTGPVRAEGLIINSGKRVATAEGKLTDGKGRLLAHATTTCLVFPLSNGG
jgi:uncharacterized protein (TIGR00369 family)